MPATSAGGEQLSDLAAELRELGGRATTPIFIDQEGGRINRLKPPLAPDYPTPAAFGRLYRRRAGKPASAPPGFTGGCSLPISPAYGINADCVPCLDVPVAGADNR